MRELVKNGPSPRQQLQGSNKETDFTWTPAHGLGRRTGPAVVLEAAYQNESVPKLKQEGKAWFEMEGVQVSSHLICFHTGGPVSHQVLGHDSRCCDGSHN